MQTFRKLEDVPRDFGPTIVSVGNFDGIHRAHRHVISEIVTRARNHNARAMVVTFDPHPGRFLRPDAGLKLLTPNPEKLRLLASTGLHAALILPFGHELSLLSARDFAHDILKDCLHTREIHEGYNFRFGHKAAGNVETLAEFGREFGFSVLTYPEMRLRRHEVSSSAIRRLLNTGQAHLARHLLGRVFSILGTAERGRGYGSKYTVPTMNLAPYTELIPANGVYITQTRVGNDRFDSVTNIGNRPTFGADSFAIESHLLNFHPIDLTPETEVEVFFLRRIREEIKFPSVDALREQIGRDVKRAQRYFRLKNLPLKRRAIG